MSAAQKRDLINKSGPQESAPNTYELQNRQNNTAEKLIP